MYKVLKNLSRIDYIFIGLIVLLTLFQINFDLSLPDYMSDITMLIQTEGSLINDILLAGFKMLLCALGSLIIAIIVAVLASRIGSSFSYVTRSKVFNKVLSFSMSDVNKFSTSSLITRTTNDITQVQMLLIIGMQMLIKAPITAIWAIHKISNKSESWTMLVGICVMILFIIVSICLSLAIPRFKRIQVLTDNINRITRENLDGLNVVRAYNAEEYQINKFEVGNKELTDVYVFTARTMSFLMPSIQMISNALVLGVYIIGAILINDAIGLNKMELFSNMVVFTSYAMQIIMSFMMLVMVFMNLPRASVSAKRINEVLEMDTLIKEGNREHGDNNHLGEVEFKNVSFKYPDAEDYIIKNVSFKANKGEVIAFIGSTGCGKSTIVNLVPRFYDVTEGEVFVNGYNVKEYKKNTLNNMIGYVSQKATLFTGTIKSNVMFGNNGLPDNINNLESSINTAQAIDFIDNLDDKFDSYVAQGGKNLSGGQKQRLSIARAIYRDPKIFIFDDSFSALDYKTDKKLRYALNETCKDTTRLIVGQRIGTIRDADKIIVLEDGIVVGIGKHKDLLNNCEIYKQIALSQLSEKELA